MLDVKYNFPNRKYSKICNTGYDRKKENMDAIEDIYDGKEYKTMSQPNGFLAESKNNFSFSMNVDGMNVSNSSNASAWPILLKINEVPPHARKKHMLLDSIWVEDFHPYLNMFLMPTISELRSLYKTGISWKADGNNEITSRFVTLICPVDSVHGRRNKEGTRHMLITQTRELKLRGVPVTTCRRIDRS